MERIVPISFEDADGKTREIYEDILSSLESKNLPEIFRYMANFPEFFVFSWEQIKPLIASDDFKSASNQLEMLSEQIIALIYSPSKPAENYVNELSESRLARLEDTSKDLIKLNAKVLIISIAIRESLKGIIITDDQKYINGKSENRINTHLVKTDPDKSLELIDLELKKLYPDFYSIISNEIQELNKKEGYLKARVELERITQMLIEKFSKQLNFPFRKTVEMLRQNPNSDEILHLLHSTFPSNYPHLLFTSTLMLKLLQENNHLSISS